jgi:ferrous iron transport protein A
MTAATAPDFAPTSAALPRESASASLDVSLASLPPGRSARIVEVDESGPGGERLLDLGFVPGTVVAVLKRAPLRDPVVYGLRGYRICLRASEASLVRVRPE